MFALALRTLQACASLSTDMNGPAPRPSFLNVPPVIVQGPGVPWTPILLALFLVLVGACWKGWREIQVMLAKQGAQACAAARLRLERHAEPRDAMSEAEAARTHTPFYPKVAQEAGVEGRAKIRCQVTAERRLDHCAIASETPPGCGFGQAALGLAPQQRVKPNAKIDANGYKLTTVRFRLQ